ELIGRLPAARERHLDAFLTDLLRDAPRSLGKETRRVAAFRTLDAALSDQPLKRAEESERLGSRARFVAEAGATALVTHRTARPRADKQRVAVAVDGKVNEIESVAGGLAFFPETRAAAAVEDDTAPLEGCRERGRV